jgi:hypothetical protein
MAQNLAAPLADYSAAVDRQNAGNATPMAQEAANTNSDGSIGARIATSNACDNRLFRSARSA